jgi:hypothetical protein
MPAAKVLDFLRGAAVTNLRSWDGDH